MKQLIITIGLILFAAMSFSRPSNAVDVKDYIVTDDGVTYVDKVRLGWGNSMIGVTEKGSKLKFDKKEVKAYRKKGREFKRLYLVEKGSYYVKSVFLERIYTRAGYTIYKKITPNRYDFDLNDLYVYKGENLELQLNNENYKVVLSFFFPTFNKMFNS